MIKLFLAMMFVRPGEHDIELSYSPKEKVGTDSRYYYNIALLGLAPESPAIVYIVGIKTLKVPYRFPVFTGAIKRKLAYSISWCTTGCDHLKWKPPKIKAPNEGLSFIYLNSGVAGNIF